MRRRFLTVLLAALLGLSFAATAAWADWGPRPPRPGATTGTLVVVSRPWSNVTIDGRRLGPTPLQIELSPGRHRLELKSGDARHRERITIRAGVTKRVMHRF